MRILGATVEPAAGGSTAGLCWEEHYGSLYGREGEAVALEYTCTLESSKEPFTIPVVPKTSEI